PWFTMLMTALQVAGLVLSLVVNAQVTGTVIQTTPQFNYLIGPSSEVLIQLGARFAPCMRAIDTLPASLATNVSCVVPGGPADPNNPGYYSCNWDTFCGRLAPTPLTPTTPRAPNQWFRFVLPLFLHGGVIHFAMNIMVQLSSVMSLERDWGWFRVGPVYLVSGVFGFVFGAAFGAPLSPSVGCSGALFGMIACMIIDLVQHWRIVHHPTNALLRILFVVAVTFVIGLFPAIDNFAHIGGFISGGLMGLVVMPTRGLFGNYSVMSLLVRVAAVVAVGILFAALIPAFYSGSGLVLCPWCRSLDCV
ncbi:rhomboid family-domain-containing protein, partial [Blastocladiella britannica]